MAVALRLNTDKARLIRTLTAGPLRLNTEKARLIPTFTVGPLLPRTARARTTPALTDTIHPLLRTTTHHDATTAVAWQPAPQSRVPRRLRGPQLARPPPRPTPPPRPRTPSILGTRPDQ